LPVICQNPSEKVITWQELRGQANQNPVTNNRAAGQNHQPLFGGRWFQKILLLSAITTGVVMGIRYLGIMQPWELQAFDQLMRSRFDDQVDPRIIVITVTEDDLKLPQNLNRKGSLSDLALDLVLQKN
jgi:CHASE2 domain-containing sensor protein